MEKNNLELTLEQILDLIKKDVEIISETVEKQLDSHTAATLCKYASTLSAIKTDLKKEETNSRKTLDKKSTDDLIKEYLELSKK